MNIIKYKAKFDKKSTCVCIVDNTEQYNSWTRELVKNRADYTITNCTGMGYDVFVGKHIDNLLQSVSDNYQVAVIISAGTEFINGNSFFKSIPENFSLIGHILDAGEGYYMLHPQCYVLNLEVFNFIGKPFVGEQKYFESFSTAKPLRSKENIHDEYTPLWLKPGIDQFNYKHTYHGWNLIKSLLENSFIIEAFNTEQRNNKHYLYTDVNTSDWIYKRYNYCLTDHIYKENTGEHILPLNNGPVGNIVVPAAGLNWYNTLEKYGYKDSCIIKFYDYNVNSLEWVKSQTKELDICFEYHRIDILSQPLDFLKLIDSNTDYIEFSNIFAYEATAALIPLKHRLESQNLLINKIKEINPDCYIHFDQRAEDGFVENVFKATRASITKVNSWEDLYLPYWHT